MTLPSILAHLRAHGIEPTKALSQNFLTDLNITHKIVRMAGDLKNKTIIEIGPGPGGLTRAILAEEPARLVSIEHDRQFTDLLAEIAAQFSNFSVLYDNALMIDLMTLGSPPRHVIANLPYQVATPLLLGWLRQWHTYPSAFASLTLMFQREVADRLVAQPYTKAYGRLSVMAQWICRIDKCFDLPPHVFLPPPKVTSTVTHFTRRSEHVGDFETMEQMVAVAFGQRRKTLKKAMKTTFPQIAEGLEALGISQTARAEELRVDQFVDLAAFKAGSEHLTTRCAGNARTS